MALEFLYRQPVEIHFGAGNVNKLREVLAQYGVKNAVLVCGRHFAPEAEKLKAESGVICAIFSGVEPNPRLSGAAEAMRLARENGADALIGVGGGSAIDTAKFAAACAPGDRDAEYYYSTTDFPAQPLKIFAVPTTAGTGSEVTQVSVISHGAEKKTINNPVFMPTAAIVDPMLTVSVPPRTTMNTGLDALAHALEGYWSVNHQPISDLMAVEAVRLIMENLEQAYTHGDDLNARTAMSMASLLGGLSFALPKTAGVHACSYPLSEDCHLPHGEACAFTLDSFVEINRDARLDELCRRAGLRDSAELAVRIRVLKHLAGLRTRLSELETGDAKALAAKCAVHPLMGNNPVKMDAAALEKMFEALR